MDDKKVADLVTGKYQPKPQIKGKFIMILQRIVLSHLTASEEQLEKRRLSSDQGGYKPQPATSAYSSKYCSMSAVITGILTVYH